MALPQQHSPSTAAAKPARNRPAGPVRVGQVWSVDASGLDPRKLAGDRGLVALQGLFGRLIEVLGLNPVGAPLWHVFDGEHAGVTGIVALSESHLAAHTFPEHGGLTLDLYTCVNRAAPDWHQVFAEHMGLKGALGEPAPRPTLEIRCHDRSLRRPPEFPSDLEPRP